MNSRQRRKHAAAVHNQLTPTERAALKGVIGSAATSLGLNQPGETAPTQAEILRGQFMGNCNRVACQKPNSAHHYNEETHAYYCEQCAMELQKQAGEDWVLFKDIHKEMYQS